MQFSTTPTLEGQTIVEYCGVVTGEAILGANIFRDFFAGIRDIVGGRPVPTKKNCVKRGRLPLRSSAPRRERWGLIPSSVLISTTKRSGKTAVC